jgi:hypothetical protein
VVLLTLTDFEFGNSLELSGKSNGIR